MKLLLLGRLKSIMLLNSPIILSEILVINFCEQLAPTKNRTIEYYFGCDYSHGTVTEYFIAKVTETKTWNIFRRKINYHQRGLNPVSADHKSRALPATPTSTAAQTPLILCV